MPYKDPEQQKEAKRRYYAKRYAKEQFRKDEAERKAEWYDENSDERKAVMLRYIRAVRKAAKKGQKSE